MKKRLRKKMIKKHILELYKDCIAIFGEWIGNAPFDLVLKKCYNNNNF